MSTVLVFFRQIIVNPVIPFVTARRSVLIFFFAKNFQGGVITSLSNGGIYIRSLVPGGAAERDGRLHTGNVTSYHI